MTENQKFDNIQELEQLLSKVKKEFGQLTPEQKAKKSKEFEKRFRKFTSRKSNSSICCMWGNCQDISINSHAISKKRYLEGIAINDHVMGTESRDDFNSDRRFIRNLNLKQIGVNDATVFKGYCKRHDDMLFERIDNHPIENLKDILLHCLRVVDFSLYSTRWATEQLRCQLKEIADVIGSEYFRYFFHGQYDPIEPIDLLRSYLLRGLDDVCERENNYPFAYNLCYSIGGGYQLYFKRVHLSIPVAMYNFFPLSTGDMMYVISLPTKEYTDLIYICTNDFGLRWQLEITRDDLSILNFLESCMVAFECWVSSPKIFESMSDEKKAFIQADLYNGFGRQCFNEHVNYDISIFDEIRRELLDNLPDDDERKSEEERKLNTIPSRDATPSEETVVADALGLQQFIYWGI